ncbi:hypothetical protein NP233_g7914 [Leucocoprinus birnbaumii]|uniref:DUF6699 domain-containing protein n=1 Tax=Leucocoprinus birnbaumii TaxID=56174 RepID=A0AAD5VTS8_9AGAR|nr:hypothetical protein NP233_g7914 [Leucocoprinus birnbaumii]
MFHYTGAIRSDPYTICNGFVRPDYRSALPMSMAWPSYQWSPYTPLPAYSSHLYPSPAFFPGGNGASSIPATNGWKYTPLKSQEPSLNKSHRPSPSSGPASSRSSPSGLRNTSGSGRSSRHSSPPGATFDWRKVTQYPSDIALHRELQWHRTWTPNSLGLHWDVTRPPSLAKALSSRYDIVAPEFDSPALHKSAEGFELWPDHPILARYVYELHWGVVPVPNSNPTVLELVQAIYDYLSTPLTETDLRYIHSTPQNEQLLEKARKQRVEEGYYAVSDVGHKGPFKRSDVLGSHRCFHGIRAVKMGDGKDVFFFNLGPGRVPRY